MTREEWIKEGRAYYQEQLKATGTGSLRGWSNKNWKDPETGEVWMLTSKTRKGQEKPDDGSSYTPKSIKAQERQKQARDDREDFAPALMTALEKYGLEHKYDEYLAEIRKGHTAWKNAVRDRNKGRSKEERTSRGHMGALANAWPDVPENIIFENQVINQSRIAGDDPPDINIRMAGGPRDMEEWVIKRAIRENDPTYDLPQEVKELVLQAKDDEEIDNLLADYYGQTDPITQTLQIGAYALKPVQTAGLAILSQGQKGSPLFRFTRDHGSELQNPYGQWGSMNKARERGGKISIGNFVIPELGLSEFFTGFHEPTPQHMLDAIPEIPGPFLSPIDPTSGINVFDGTKPYIAKQAKKDLENLEINP